ncbi:hypothetical protein BD324DRAFT_246136 [Kockovaella imperatae]|uniref:RING-type domain-containing protein n=1 Tax=Kockovaella imperatae TaxID=4999 RepID=A0A1Y1UPH6_9TREE|nr:hypothetical protein BD324DRAFT_246136 [Kockovaella imperatae]ORX39960.1 hypothetical protein BD324DRAFT_246136 [Kockovaella imperatae]
MPSSSIHPLPVNPTTGQQPLASLGGVRVSSTSGNVASGSVGGVSRDTLKGLQDVVWSDDEDDPDCLLCAEPLDLSDLNFKPCQCGMQICQFCYNKLLGSDARCPGCRRPYDAKAVVFQPVDWDEVKRAKEKKTRRAKTIKQLTSMGRRHLLNVRIVMKNTVYVVGMKLPAPGDESIPILRSGDYFGQYGKISRIYLRDRTTLSSTAVHTLTPDDPSTSTGIYIVYVRREDAARAISALDGIAAPQGPPGRTLKATYATCRYCDAFLKGQKCDNPSCQNLHEWGGDSDCFTKDDMEIALTRPAEYDARQQEARARASSLSKTAPISKPATLEDVIASGLPNSAGWAKGAVARPVANGKMTAAAPIGSSRPVKTPSVALSLNNNAAFPLPTPSPVNPAPKDKRSKASSTKMARGKSSDSTQSGNTSSAHTSPKRKNLPLAPTALTNQITPIPLPNSKAGPPPGLLRPALDTQGDSQLPDDLQDGSVSAESEAGPSSSSPAPQTPSRLTDGPPLPPPLTSDPICIHSPYEEPRMFPFPASDPAFEFVLSIDEETQRQAQEFDYTPSAFGKTLFGLAQLGILAPDVLDPSPPPRTEINGVSGLFSPFDASSEGNAQHPDSTLPGLPVDPRYRGIRVHSLSVWERMTGLEKRACGAKAVCPVSGRVIDLTMVWVHK